MTDKRLPITNLPIENVPASAIVCGDPARADKTAAFLTDAKLLSDQREYRAYTGLYQDTPIMVCSHGVGAPGAAVAFEELIAAGVHRIIRVGSCGGMQTDIQAGDLVIATAALPDIGYARGFAPPHYPAVAAYQLVMALDQTAQAAGLRAHTGLVITRDIFYAGVETPFSVNYKTLSEANVLAVEMECAALFIIGSLRGIQTAAILAVDGNVLQAPESMDTYAPHRGVVARAIEAEIKVALEVLVQLA